MTARLMMPAENAHDRLRLSPGTAGTPMMVPDPATAEVYQQLINCCPKLRLGEPWSWLPLDQDCRGPLPKPPGNLAFLRRRFGEDLLVHAGVIQRESSGKFRLNPALWRTKGALVALRKSPEQAPFDLVTMRGCLSNNDPISAAMEDARTLADIGGRRTLFVAFGIRDVVLLRLLGFPATLATRILRYGLTPLLTLENTIPKTRDDFDFVSEQDQKTAPTEPLRPFLALVGWSPLTPSNAVHPLLFKCADKLTAARRDLDLMLAGITVWHPCADLQCLRDRLACRDLPLIQKLLRKLLSDTYDFEEFSQGRVPQPVTSATESINLVSAQAVLRACLAEERGLRQKSERVHQARSIYESCVEQELIQPLLESTMAKKNLLARSLGFELVNNLRLLHCLAPTLQATLTDDRPDLRDSKLGCQLDACLQLGKRVSTLIRDQLQLRRWR